LDLIPKETERFPRQAAISDNLGGIYATSGLFCDSESKTFTAMMHWSSEATLECQTLDASAYFEDSVVNYQLGNYAVSPAPLVTTGNFTLQPLDDIKPFIQNLCNGCGNLAGISPGNTAENTVSAIASGQSIILHNQGSTPLNWELYSLDGKSIAQGVLAPGLTEYKAPNTGLYLVRIEKTSFKLMLVRD
jgi:hypothetical protein